MSDNNFDGELVVGLIYAVGTRTDTTINSLTQLLNNAGYDVEVIKVSSDVIPKMVTVDAHEETDEYARISAYMDAGNRARRLASEKIGSDEESRVLGYGVAARINAKRIDSAPKQKTAHIIDSLKHPSEIDALKKIYSNGFVTIGLHSSYDRKVDHLIEKNITRESADNLIRRDADESESAFGQRVNKTFHLADFFLNVGSNEDLLRCDIRRMVELWFGCPFHTPTFDEYAMFMAFSASLRSADLSRQIGSVISKNSDIISTGANDCTKPGGGLYWPERKGDCISDAPNGRDYTRGGDSNTKERTAIIEDIVTKAATDHQLDGQTIRNLLDSSRIQDLTEFGRVVHAEMEALLSCARRGVTTVDAHIYTTTFPCHNCAKHIIASGITRVIYVEPYEKSKALEFHDDAIITDPSNQSPDSSKVLFEPFVGIGPRRFFDVFSMKLSAGYDLKRKDGDGNTVNWDISDSKLRLFMKPSNYIDLEDEASSKFEEMCQQPGDQNE